MFDKVRIDPETLMLDIGDLTFAVSNGTAFDRNNNLIDRLPLGVVMACAGELSTGQVSVSGSPFVITEAFATTGDAGARGNVDLWESKQTVEMVSTGDCALTAPAGVTTQVTPGTFAIQLTYAPR